MFPLQPLDIRFEPLDFVLFRLDIIHCFLVLAQRTQRQPFLFVLLFFCLPDHLVQLTRHRFMYLRLHAVTNDVATGIRIEIIFPDPLSFVLE